MKVRWREDSLRLRITPDELATLQMGASVTETAGFPSGWSVTLALGAESALGTTEPGQLVFTLQADALQALSQPETEGVYFATERYKFFVEKDFPCAHPRPQEAQEPHEATETFVPPSGFAQRHRSAC